MPLSNSDANSLDLLYVDLDGTLTATDSLLESLVALVRARPSSLPRVLVWLIRGKAYLRSRVASASSLDPALLPYRQELVVDLRARRARGTQLVLATAAHEELASSVANHLGLFDSVISSDDRTIMRGREKLLAIREHAQGRSFGYVGNATVDLPSMAAADTAFVAGAHSDGIRKRLTSATSVEVYSQGRWRYADLWRLIRPRHWFKNALLFIPLVTSQQVTQVTSVAGAAAAFAAFSLTASGGYVVNDLLDVHADRRHPMKAKRPVAAGSISIMFAAVFALGLLGSGFAIAAFLPAGFRVTLAAYVCVSLAYTLALKRVFLLDVVALASAFVLRVVAGAEAIEVTISYWLLAFSLFFFASLALTKRCSELHNLQADGRTASYGRAYRTDNLAVLQIVGMAAGLVSVSVLALYIRGPISEALYSRPGVLWMMTPLLLYWVTRIWAKAVGGQLEEDPLLFSIGDPASWAVMILGVILILMAK